MNTTYCVVWNCAKGVWTVASELAHSCRVRRGGTRRRLSLAFAGAIVMAMLCGPAVVCAATAADGILSPHLATDAQIDAVLKHRRQAVTPPAAQREEPRPDAHATVAAAPHQATVGDKARMTVVPAAVVATGKPHAHADASPASTAKEPDDKADDHTEMASAARATPQPRKPVLVADAVEDAALPRGSAGAAVSMMFASPMVMQPAAIPVGSPLLPPPPENPPPGLVIGTGGVIGGTGATINPVTGALLNPADPNYEAGALTLSKDNVT
ncbi:MAG TPA: ESPR-type extended signal peptide-containing protein, partial [Rhodanobacteraceae bacterium]|nr:ESPR-type extended signal peptide-containing protein [Rhodanobacteraceae bacterium]